MTGRRLLQRGRAASPVPLGLPGPHAVQVNARTVEVGGLLHTTLAVTGYPRDVGPGWLEPLLDHPSPIDVTLHLHPVATAVAAERLRRQLARGEGRLFQVGLYVTIRGRSPAEVDAETAQVQALVASLLLDAHPTSFRALQGWVSTLPLGLDRLRLHRTMDTCAVAAAFPFASADLPLPTDGGGVLLGRIPATGGLLGWDRWAQPNHNQVILARSGAGKSYLAKLEALRWLYQGVQVLIIDPEAEYQRLADAVGGHHPAAGRPRGPPGSVEVTHVVADLLGLLSRVVGVSSRHLVSITTGRCRDWGVVPGRTLYCFRA